MTHIDMLEQLFSFCDTRGTGTLTVDDLQRINPELSLKEVKLIFDQMDSDHDGLVTKNDFIGSYQRFISQGEKQFQNLGRRMSNSTPDQSGTKLSQGRNKNPSLPEVVYHSDDCVKLDQLQW